MHIPHIRNTTSLFISPCVCSLCQRLVHVFLHHSSELQKPQRWCFRLLVWSSLRPWEGNNCLDPSNSCFIRNGFCPSVEGVWLSEWRTFPEEHGAQEWIQPWLWSILESLQPGVEPSSLAPPTLLWPCFWKQRPFLMLITQGLSPGGPLS